MSKHTQSILSFVFTIPILLAACSPDEDAPPDDAWYHAIGYYGLYEIARADLDEDSCVWLSIAAPQPSIPEPWPNVEVMGADAVVYGALRTDSVEQCRTGSAPSHGTNVGRASGTIRLRDFVTTTEGESWACAIDVDLVLDDMLLRRDGIPVWGPDCPRPPGEVETLVGVGAAYSQQDQELTIVGWDATREACTWVLFRTSDTQSGGGVDVPTNWYSASAHIAPMASDACNASTIWQHDTAAVGESASVSSYEGTVSFLTSTPAVAQGYEFEIPCSLQVDITFRTDESYVWLANQLELRGSSVEVAGACE